MINRVSGYVEKSLFTLKSLFTQAVNRRDAKRGSLPGSSPEEGAGSFLFVCFLFHFPKEVLKEAKMENNG